MKNLLISICLVSFMLLTGCEEDIKLNPEGFTELMSDINGSWKIDQVTQNDIDITNALDFQSFILDLNYDGGTPSTFSLASKVPFVTNSADGSWSFDDPAYPTAINFSDGTSAKITDPIVSSGAKNLNLEIILGCGNTVYLYKLSK